MLIAFDLDGVLYSSEPFLADAYRDAIARVNARRPGSFARVPESAEIFAHIGWPVSTILARLFPDADAEAMRLIYDITLEVICERVARREGTLTKQVGETLDRLHAAGHTSVVASNGRRQYVETVLRTYALEAYFAELLTVDSIEPPEKPALLQAYVARHRVSPQETVMVGDRASDVEAARAVGCHFVGCDYGHGHRSEIDGHGPVISALTALPEVVAAFNPRRV